MPIFIGLWLINSDRVFVKAKWQHTWLSCPRRAELKLSFLAGTSSLIEVFMGHGNLSWLALMWSMRSDEFDALWPSLRAEKAWGQRPAHGGYPVPLLTHASRKAGTCNPLPGPSSAPRRVGLGNSTRCSLPCCDPSLSCMCMYFYWRVISFLFSCMAGVLTLF